MNYHDHNQMNGLGDGAPAMMSKDRPYDCLRSINCVKLIHQKSSNAISVPVASIKIAPFSTFYLVFGVLGLLILVGMICGFCSEFKVTEVPFYLLMMCLPVLFMVLGFYSWLYASRIHFYPDHIEAYYGAFPKPDLYKKFYCGANHLIEKDNMAQYCFVYIDKYCVARNLCESDATLLQKYLEFYLNGQ